MNIPRRGKTKEGSSQPFPVSSPPDNMFKGKKKFKKRATPKMWTDEEEVALANAWISVSEDAVAGKSQRETFFVKVTRYYNKVCSYERSKDQLYSKWKDMNAKMKKFGGIFNQERDKYRFGFSEDDYKQRAHVCYRNENNGKLFTNEAAWKVLKNHPAWLQQADFQNDDALNSRPLKKSKATPDQNTTSSDARCQFNEDDYDVDIQESQRPIGQDKTKPAAFISSMVSGLRGYMEQIKVDNNKLLSVEENIAQRMSEKLDIMRQKEKRKMEEKKQNDLEFFIKPQEHLEGIQLNAVLKLKEEISQKYNW